MAAIGKIRQRSGLLIIIVGVALAAFILGDMFQNMGRGQMKYDPTVIAYINGEKIPSNMFSERVEENSSNMMRNQKKSDLTNEERYSVQIQTWDLIKSETVLHQQAYAVGLIQENGADAKPGLSTEEYAQLLTGENPHPFVEQNFRGQDGKFDPTLVTRFLSSVEAGLQSENPQDREQALQSQGEWDMLEKYIKSDRISTKYFNLITKAYFIPKTIAEEKYFERNDSRNIRFVALRYGMIQDTAVDPSEADYETFYEEHKNEYISKEETRSLDYIVWDVKPSDEDIMDIEKNLDEMYQEMQVTSIKEMPFFVNRNSENPYDSSWKAPGSLSPFIDSIAFASEPGTVFAPWRENKMYHMGRLMDVQMRPDSMRASHILVAYAGAMRAAEDITRTKIGAAALADSLLDVAQNSGLEFGMLAEQHSDGPTGKSSQGDLDWFADGTMAPEFNEACVSGNVGDIVKVETVFGYHIIKITGKKDPVKKVRVAQIDVPIMFSQKTYEKVFNEASQFVSRARDAESFDTVSVNMGMNVMQANDLTQMANGLSGVKSSRKIVQWLYNENTDLGNVSDVFDFNDKIVVALYKHNTPKGVRPLDDDMKDFLKALVMRDVKAKMLEEQYTGATTLEGIAQQANVKVDTMDFMTFAAYSLKGYGPEPHVMGTMLAAPVKHLLVR
jgi:peptidyl-prolyl cis-trans isomerase D